MSMKVFISNSMIKVPFTQVPLQELSFWVKAVALPINPIPFIEYFDQKFSLFASHSAKCKEVLLENPTGFSPVTNPLRQAALEIELEVQVAFRLTWN